MRIEGVDQNLYYSEKNPYYIDQIAKNSLDEAFQKDLSAEDNLNSKEEKQRDQEFLFAEKGLLKAIESTNEDLEVYNRKIEFSIHEKTKDIMIKVVDRDTDEIIREIPPEKIKDMVANILEKAGLLIDERV